jgi:hypothetical protein
MTATPTHEKNPDATGSVTFVDGVGPGLRASDADRHATVARLQEAVALGLLTHEEGSDRMAVAYDARYLSDLPPLTADLPLPQAAAPAARRAAPGWRALLAMAWVQLRTLVAGSATGRPSRRRLAVVGAIGIALVVLLVLGAWGLDGLFGGGGPGGGGGPHGGFRGH